MSDPSERDAFERGCAFVETCARPLDVARLHLRLGRGSSEAVVTALAAFQNADGGFGHGLEPDLATPASTAIATSVAFQVLRDAGVGAGEPMVQGGLGWLEAAFDWERGVWPIIGREVDLAPHAFWWDWDEDLPGSWNGFRFNPSAELLGALYAYRSTAAPALLARAEEALVADLSAGRAPDRAFDIKCALRLLRTAEAPAALKAALAPLLKTAIAALEPDDLHAPVLELAPAPGEALADLFSGRIDAAFAGLIAEQQPDGGWDPFWDWSAVDAAAWEAARADWRGILTRQAVEALLAHGRAGTG